VKPSFDLFLGNYIICKALRICEWWRGICVYAHREVSQWWRAYSVTWVL